MAQIVKSIVFYFFLFLDKSLVLLIRIHSLIENQFEFIVYIEIVRLSPFSILQPGHRRREQRVDSHPHNLLYQLRNKLGKHRPICLQTGIRIDLNQPRLELMIEHEIKTEKFKSVKSFIKVDFHVARFHCMKSQLLHFRLSLLFEIVFTIYI